LRVVLMSPTWLAGPPELCPQAELYALIFVTLSAYDGLAVAT
jgi:hypothetical protein